ncbi:hypothetical protein KC678_00155 [Candidatus Dojkabacteria bacterium]|uniref:Uncharacterized protein n=1 Tax=Candidatus Dojkabacteria bacterium TaxID=2099670 RepID=A0A955IA92_9BACT|nr:hypothetical protein [Candidatus Dojkabacteria bacterium]
MSDTQNNTSSEGNVFKDIQDPRGTGEVIPQVRVRVQGNTRSLVDYRENPNGDVYDANEIDKMDLTAEQREWIANRPELNPQSNNDNIPDNRAIQPTYNSAQNNSNNEDIIEGEWYEADDDSDINQKIEPNQISIQQDGSTVINGAPPQNQNNDNVQQDDDVIQNVTIDDKDWSNRINNAGTEEEINNLARELQGLNIDNNQRLRLQRQINTRAANLSRINRISQANTDEDDKVEQDRPVAVPVANLDTKDDSPTVTADDLDDLDTPDDEDILDDIDDVQLTTIREALVSVYDRTREGIRERLRNRREELNVIRQELIDSWDARTEDNTLTRLGVGILGTGRVALENIRNSRTLVMNLREKLRGPELTDAEKKENDRAIKRAYKVSRESIQKGIRGEDNSAFRANLFYRSTRGVLRGMLQTQRLINRVENTQLGRYIAQARVLAGTNSDGSPRYEYTALGDSRLNRRQRFWLNFRELTGIYRDQDFVVRGGMNVAQKKELADAIANAGLTMSEEIARKGRRSAINAFSSGRGISGRLSRTNAVRNGIALGLRLGASTLGVMGIQPESLYNLTRLASMTISPLATIANKRREMIDKFGTSAWKRMVVPMTLMSGISGYLSYLGPLREASDNIVNDLLVNRAGGVLLDDAKKRTAEMVTSWGLRYTTNYIAGPILGTMYALVYGAGGADQGQVAGRWKRSVGLGLASASIAAQGASMAGAISFASDIGLVNATKNILFGKHVSIENSPDPLAVYESQNSDGATELLDSTKEIITSLVADGNEAVNLPNGDIGYLNVGGVLVPLEHPNVPKGIMNDLVNRQPNNIFGNPVASASRQLTENAGIAGDLFNGVDRDQVVVNIGSGSPEYVRVSGIELDPNIRVPWNTGERTLLNVPDGVGSSNSMLYLGHDQIGYGLNNGEVNLVMDPENPAILRQIGNPGALYSAPEVEAYINGNTVNVPNPIGIEVYGENGDVTRVLRHVSDVPNVDDRIFGGVATYQDASELTGNVYNANGDVIAFKAENIRIPVDGQEVQLGDTYAVQSPTEANQYFVGATSSTRIGLERDPNGEFVVNKVVFNNHEYLYGQSPDQVGTTFYFSGSATENPSAVELIRDSVTGNLTAHEVFTVNPTNDPNVFELPFGVDPNNLTSLQTQAGSIDQIDFFTTNNAGRIVGIGPAENGIRRVFEATGHAPGSTLRLIENQSVIENNIHTIATGNSQNGPVQYLVPADGSADPGDLVYSLNSEAPTTLAPNSNHIAYLMGTTQNEVAASIEFDNAGNIISFNGTNLELENGAPNYDLINTIHRDFGIDTNRPIILDRSNLDVTYRRIGDNSEFNPLPEQPLTPEAATLLESPAGAPVATPENNGNLLGAAQNGQGQPTTLPGQVNGAAVPSRIEGAGERVEGPFTDQLPGRSETGGEFVNPQNSTPVVTTSTRVDPSVLVQGLRDRNFAYGNNTGALYVATDVYNQLSNVQNEQQFNAFLSEYGITLADGRDAQFYLGSTENRWHLSFDVADAVATADYNRVIEIRDSADPQALTTAIMQTWRQGVEKGTNNILADNITPYITPQEVAIQNAGSARLINVNIDNKTEVTVNAAAIPGERDESAILDLVQRTFDDLVDTSQTVLDAGLNFIGGRINDLDRILADVTGLRRTDEGLFEGLIERNLGENTAAGQELRRLVNPIGRDINIHPERWTLGTIALLGLSNWGPGQIIRMPTNFAFGKLGLDMPLAKTPHAGWRSPGKYLLPQSRRAELEVVRIERNLKQLERELDRIDLLKVKKGYGTPGAAIPPGAPAAALTFQTNQTDRVNRIKDRIDKYETKYGIDKVKVKRKFMQDNLNTRLAKAKSDLTPLAARISLI